MNKRDTGLFIGLLAVVALPAVAQYVGGGSIGGASTSSSSGVFASDVSWTGNGTFGDAAGDTITSNAAAWTFPTDTAVTLTGGVDGINFSANALSIDGTNDRIGIGTAAPNREIQISKTVGSPVAMEITNGSASGTVRHVLSAPSSESEWASYGASVAGSVAGINLAGLQRFTSQGASSTGMMLDTATADPIYFVTNATHRGTISSVGHWRILNAGTPSSYTSGTCTNETGVGDDQHGAVTADCTAGQTIVVSFATTWGTAPHCVCTPANANAAAAAGGAAGLYCDASTTALTITAASAFGGTAGEVNFFCME